MFEARRRARSSLTFQFNLHSLIYVRILITIFFYSSTTATVAFMLNWLHWCFFSRVPMHLNLVLHKCTMNFSDRLIVMRKQQTTTPKMNEWEKKMRLYRLSNIKYGILLMQSSIARLLFVCMIFILLGAHCCSLFFFCIFALQATIK